MAAMVHAIPIPRKTLTALEPVTLPTELSAVSSSIAAVLEAKVSERNDSLKICSKNLALISWHALIFLTGQCVLSWLNIYSQKWQGDLLGEGEKRRERARDLKMLTSDKGAPPPVRCPGPEPERDLVTRQHLTLQLKTHLQRKQKR